MPPTDHRTLLFPLGLLNATPGALAVLEANRTIPLRLIARHCLGDWGEIGPADARVNAAALHLGERLISCYRLADGEAVWVMTEADRSTTTLLLPSEY